MQVLHLEGLPFETADTDELNYRKSLRDATLRALGSSRFALYHHVIRRRVDPVDAGVFPDAFSQRLDQVWTQRLRAKELFRNDIFLSIVRRPLQGRGGFAEAVADLLGRRITDRAAMLAAERRALDATRDTLLASLSSYGARALGVYRARGSVHSELLEFLSALFNGEMRPMKLPQGDVGEYVPYRRVSFGQQTLELAPAGEKPRTFSGLISIKDYPGEGRDPDRRARGSAI
jgi:type IV secretion system protein VirB4